MILKINRFHSKTAEKKSDEHYTKKQLKSMLNLITQNNTDT